MNTLNYASLEASKRLVEEGIVLETEALWVKWYFDSSTNMNYHPYEWRLMYRGLTQDDLESIPAPTMAEVWREFPERLSIRGLFYEPHLIRVRGFHEVGYFWFDRQEGRFSSINPTDALINLLIHIKGIDAHK